MKISYSEWGSYTSHINIDLNLNEFAKYIKDMEYSIDEIEDVQDFNDILTEFISDKHWDEIKESMSYDVQETKQKMSGSYNLHERIVKIFSNG